MTAAKIFRIATGVGRFTVVFTAVGGILDSIFLAYNSYKIHKRSDNSAAKEVRKKLEELGDGRNQLLQLKECLGNLLNKEKQ